MRRVREDADDFWADAEGTKVDPSREQVKAIEGR